MPALSVEDLLALTDDDVKSAVTNQFILQLQNGASVKPTFFASVDAACNPQNPDYVDSLACAFVCSSIGQSSLFGFSACIQQAAVESYIQAALADSNQQAVTEGQALYAWAFPDHCRSANACFRDYLNDGGPKWAQQLAAAVTTSPFIDTDMNKWLAEANWLEQLNLVFYKLYVLDPTTVAAVLATWQAAWPSWNIVQNWSGYNFIPTASFSAVPTLFISAVNGAISVKTQTDKTFIPGHGGPGGGEPGYYNYRYTYGLQVSSFIAAKPQALGFTTGAQPKNVETDSDNPGAHASGCFIAGTRVQLADGSSVAIDQIRENHEVLAQAGRSAFHSDEYVVIDIERPSLIFGIDDGTTAEQPFFSGGHMFWTAQGWKAIAPQVARLENPKRRVGQLQPGDVVYRLKQLDPLTYEEVRIRGFTQGVLKRGERLYGLHLVDGPRSYHANGYLVAMNYPAFTERRLAEGFARLSAAERRSVAQHLQPILPMLKAALGPFVEAPIQRAVRGERRRSRRRP